MYDTIRFCIWDDVAGYAVHGHHEQIGIFHRIYIRRLLRMGDIIRSCIWKIRIENGIGLGFLFFVFLVPINGSQF